MGIRLDACCKLQLPIVDTCVDSIFDNVFVYGFADFGGDAEEGTLELGVNGGLDSGAD